MKQTLILIVFTVFSLSIPYQNFAQSKLENWKELKDFHGVMSQTFHPSEKGDLKPIRERSGEMAEKAKTLADSKIPAEFNNAAVKEAVGKLKVDCQKLNQIIQNKGKDDEVKLALGKLHDTFHLIVERCQKPGEEH